MIACQNSSSLTSTPDSLMNSLRAASTSSLYGSIFAPLACRGSSVLIALGVLERAVLKAGPDFLEFVRVRQLVACDAGRVVQLLEVFLFDRVEFQGDAHGNLSKSRDQPTIVRSRRPTRQHGAQRLHKTDLARWKLCFITP
jgi:hypothetical protein